MTYLLETPRTWLNRLSNPKAEKFFLEQFFGIEEEDETSYCESCLEVPIDVVDTLNGMKTDVTWEKKLCKCCRDKEIAEGYESIEDYIEYNRIINIHYIKTK